MASLPAVAFGQTLSNGTGGGAWESPSTWANGIVPGTGTEFRIVEGDTVTADNLGTIQDNNSNRNIYGTMNVNGNTNVRMGRLNNGVESFGTVNLNGGTFSVTRLSHTSTSRVTLNVNSGTFTVRDPGIAISNGLSININGGEFRFGGPSLNNHSNNSSGVIIQMTGGSLIFENGSSGVNALTSSMGSWSGGSLYANTSSFGSGASALFNSLSSNENNIFALSSKLEKQTTTVGGSVNITQGTLAFNIYSSNADDSDQFIFNAQNLTIGENVVIDMRGVNLEGDWQDYHMTSYQIFSGNNYGGIGASVTSSGPITIGGIEYDVTWDSSVLSETGTITMVIPEPSTYALAFGAAAIGVAVIRRRRKQA